MLRQSTSSAICVFSLCFRLFGKYFAILLCCQWRMIDPFDARIVGDARITSCLTPLAFLKFSQPRIIGGFIGIPSNISGGPNIRLGTIGIIGGSLIGAGGSLIGVGGSVGGSF
jgi:hypothetical protein